MESTITDLQALKESQGGKLSARDQRQLEEAERNIARVRKAKESLGDKAPKFNSRHDRNSGGGGGGGRGEGKEPGWRGSYRGLGKRHCEEEPSSGEETDEGIRRIPWPKDTPPPIPRARWDPSTRPSTNANAEPLGSTRHLPHFHDDTKQESEAPRPDTTLPFKPVGRTTYESAPQVRDLRKEATAKFIPVAVKRKIDATKGMGGKLLEEDEVEQLEREGYGVGLDVVKAVANNKGGEKERFIDAAPKDWGTNEETGTKERMQMEEEERFRREVDMEMQEEGNAGPRGVSVLEVGDEDL